MRRREFIALVGSMATWQPHAYGQQSTPPTIGFLNAGTHAGREDFVGAFHEGLKEGGFIEGRNVIVEYRWADDQYDRLSALADELVRLKVSVIVALGSDAVALAAKTATGAIPIVFGNSGDPVVAGLVASLSRPGGNATGVSFFTTTLAAKRLELLRELVPHARTVGVLTNQLNPIAAAETKEVIAAANSLGQRLQVLAVATEADIAAAFDDLANHQVDGLLVNTDPFFLGHRTQIIGFESRHKLPTVHTIREWTMAGGVMSYGIRIADGYRQAGVYTAKILIGTKPADMPVVQPTKFELVINLKAAKVLGLTVSPTLLARADELIEQRLFNSVCCSCSGPVLAPPGRPAAAQQSSQLSRCQQTRSDVDPTLLRESS